MEQYFLDARNDARKSFYKKALVRETRTENNFKATLYSYNTAVADLTYYYDESGMEVIKAIYNYYGKYSQTTTRHQKEFFKQNGLNDKQIKELINKGKLEVDYE